MPEKKFIVESSPHIFSSNYKYKVMWLVVLALLPAAIMGVINFGARALLVIIVALSVSILTDALFEKLKGKQMVVEQGAAVVTGLLLGMILPPAVPLWVPALGSFTAIALAKHAFGGAGMTIFNPALVGRAFLVASFPAIMTRYTWPDGITSASPLGMLKAEGYTHALSFFGSRLAAYKAMFFGNIAGSIGETSALALLIGGLFLVLVKVIDWKIPAVYIGTVFVLTWLFGQDPIYHILGGGLFIGAFFMATAYEGMPITPNGRVYFALGLGILTVVIRLWGGYPEGVNYSILLMNAASPLIERLTIRKPFGYTKKKKNAESNA
ncbi:RnfABCDGE type electron transport complex subunit D [Candidatus Woesearchaeota archaeon]|nr:RnfABCDGE type electron transport complex subunit D [Candidatus Woesearchaeota archaeon]